MSEGTGAPVVGLPVKSSEDAKVGKITDVLVSNDGKVDKVVVDVGGVLGIGGKDVTVDWKDLQIDPTQREARLAMSQEQLKSAPAYHAPRRVTETAPSSSPAGSTAPMGRSNRSE